MTFEVLPLKKYGLTGAFSIWYGTKCVFELENKTLQTSELNRIAIEFMAVYTQRAFAVCWIQDYWLWASELFLYYGDSHFQIVVCFLRVNNAFRKKYKNRATFPTNSFLLLRWNVNTFIMYEKIMRNSLYWQILI